MEQLQAEHWKFLHGEQKLLTIHLQKFYISKGGSRAEAPVFWLDKRGGAKTTARLDDFSLFLIRTDLDLSIDHTEKRVPWITITKDDISSIEQARRMLAGQSFDGLEFEVSVGVHDGKQWMKRSIQG